MGPFSFLGNLGNSILSYLSPSVARADNVFETTLPKQMPYALGSSPTPRISVPSQPPSPALPNAQSFTNGFNQFGSNVPVAQNPQMFADAAQRLPAKVDPLLPAIISLMETGGGQNLSAANNPFNIRGTQGGQTQFINYPSLETALLGGQNGPDTSGGLVGLINNSPYYENFRNTGNLSDFFNVYTPPGEAYGNPTMDDLLRRYLSIRSLFRGGD